MDDERRPGILIIDDDGDVAQAMAIRLGSLGYDCATAEDGQAGLERFGQGGIDLVITDVNMPRQCGFDVGEAIREVSDVPIIFITGFAESYPPFMAGQRGITFVFKPIDWERLLRLVKGRIGPKGAEAVK